MKEFKQLHRPGTGTYLKGQERIENILKAATDILINNGYAGLSMRKIASTVGITIGNLHYYYPTKKDLITNLLENVISGYLEYFETIRKQQDKSAEDRLLEIITFIIEDITTPETTNFFPELWAMSNHDSIVAERMNDLYEKARQDINALVAELNPKLNDDERTQVSLFISASMEGLTPFIGNNKPFHPLAQNMINIAKYTFLNLAKNADSKLLASGKFTL